MRTLSKLGLLATLYFSQGLPFGFFHNSVPALMRSQGFSLTYISLGTLMGLPWLLKFLWAPLVDRYDRGSLGPRRSFVLPLQLMSAAVIAFAALALSEESLPLVLACMFLTNLLAATQDIATDGLAIELLKPAERGIGNGVQVAAYRLGMMAGGGGLLIFYEQLGWTRCLLAVSGVIVLASVPIAMFREAPRPSSRTRPGQRQSPLSFFRRRDAVAICCLLLATKFGDALGTTMVKPLLIDVGLGLDAVGWLIGTWGSISGLAGALAGGFLTAAIGRRRAVVACTMLQAFTLIGYARVVGSAPEYSWLLVLSVLEHFASGMTTAALFTCMMDWVRARQAATDYTAQACVVVAVTGLGGLLSGVLADAVGYRSHFMLAGCVGLVGATVAARISLRFYDGRNSPR